MSKSLLFGVYDKVAQKYIGLEVSDSEALCKRSFYNRVRMAPQSPLATYPNDFSLMLLGELDDSTGRVDSYEIPVTVCASAIPPEVFSAAAEAVAEDARNRSN